MSKDKLTDYSATNSLNTDVGGVNIDEGMLPSDVNNALREVMTHLKDFAEGTQAVNNIRFAGATTTGDINFGDNNKAVFGAGSDLQIYHNGTHSWIRDAGTGNLRLQGSNLEIQDSDGYSYIVCTDNGTGGEVSLRHNGSEKLATTATGADITGTLTADGLTVDKSNGSLITLNATNAGTPTNYIQFSDTGGNTGYVGYGSNSNDRLYIWNNTATSLADIIFGTDSTTRALIGVNGDISFYDSTGTTQGFYWDASTQRLGLGTTSPSSVIDASGSTTNTPLVRIYPSSNDVPDLSTYSGTISADVGLRIENTNASAIYSGISLNTRSLSQSSWNIYNKWTGTAVGDLLFVGRNGGASMVERMRIVGSNGFVGIGESAPEQKLHISGTFLLNNNQEIRFKDSGGSQRTAIAMSSNDLNIGTSAGGNLKFYNGSSYTERMRIDSSGNLLVGRTSTSDTNVGGMIRPDGFVQSTRDGNIAADFNRNTSDGDIVRFSKSSSPVGTIGTNSSRTYIGSGSGQSGIKFNTNAIVPVAGADGANSDNTYDLGISSARFKDLYLSGGIYLGGSGAANYLNDYEEGTWTPVPTSTGATFSTSAAGKYTKVGNLVFISMYLDNSSAPTGTLTNTMNIYGLPFANNSGGFGCVLTVGFLNFVDAPASKYQIAARVANGASYITPEWFQDDSVVTNMTAQDFDYSDARLVITGHYYTDS